MAKRFTETEKWKDKWFRQLKTSEKFLFIYLIENCDIAGFIEVDLGFWSYQTGLEEYKIEGALKGLERSVKGAGEWVWVKNFLKHQKNDDLNPANPAHRGVISKLKVQKNRFKDVEEFKEFVAPYKDLIGFIGKGKGIVKSITNVKDEPEFEKFQAAIKKFPGTKGGSETEYINFKKKHKDYKEVVHLLEPAIFAQIAHRKKLKIEIEDNPVGKHLPAWKNFQTWINNRCWEEEYGEEEGRAPVKMSGSQ